MRRSIATTGTIAVFSAMPSLRIRDTPTASNHMSAEPIAVFGDAARQQPGSHQSWQAPNCYPGPENGSAWYGPFFQLPTYRPATSGDGTIGSLGSSSSSFRTSRSSTSTEGAITEVSAEYDPAPISASGALFSR